MLLLAFLAMSFCVSIAQDPADDPLSETYIISNGGGDELATLASGYPGIKILKYYKAHEKYAHDTLIETLTWRGEGSGEIFDMDLYDLDMNHLDEFIVAWITNNMVKMAVLKLDHANMYVDPENAWEKISLADKFSPSAYAPANWSVMKDIFVRGANLDADSSGEFVVAYWAEDGMIEITAYDVDSSLSITELGSIRDQLVTEPPKMNLCEDMTSLFHLQCVDFNGDGTDEILLTGRTSIEPEGWQIFANVYAWNCGI